MKKAFILSLFVMLAARAGFSQEPSDKQYDMRRDVVSPGTVTPTPEMWFYSQERSRYEDPKAAVRRKAEFRASQRQRRLASMQWFGLSNSRPIASVTPYFGTYSPTWVSNGFDPFRWQANGPSNYVVLQPGRSTY